MLTLAACVDMQLDGLRVALVSEPAAGEKPASPRLAMVVQGRERTGIPLAINGIFGNMGVACAALLTGFLIDTRGSRRRLT